MSLMLEQMCDGKKTHTLCEHLGVCQVKPKCFNCLTKHRLDRAETV